MRRPLAFHFPLSFGAFPVSFRRATDVGRVDRTVGSLARGRSALAISIAIVLVAGMSRLALGVPPVVLGGLGCLLACGWAARHASDDRPVWLALAGASVALLLG